MKLSELRERILKHCKQEGGWRDGIVSVIRYAGDLERRPIDVAVNFNGRRLFFDLRVKNDFSDLEESVDRRLGDCLGNLLDMGIINDLEDTEPQKLMEEAKELLLKKSIAPKDDVNKPPHYTQGKVECIEAIESATIGKSGIEAVCVANVIKYLWRYEEKGGRESVEKAMWYLQKLLEKLEVKE